jgi:hypothetical protein
MPDGIGNYAVHRGFASLIAAGQEAKKDRRNRHEPYSEPLNFSFPPLEFIRKFDRSKLTSEWRKYHAGLAKTASKLGLKAIELCDLKVVLISDSTFNAAMTERYASQARQPLEKPRLRQKASTATAEHARDVMAAASKQHHQSLRGLIKGESRDTRRRMADPAQIKWLTELPVLTLNVAQKVDLALTYDTSKFPELIDSDRLLAKAYGLWQPHTAYASDVTAVGPQAYGIALDDSLGILRTETLMMGKGLSADTASDFNPCHFVIPKTQQWKMALVQSGARRISSFAERGQDIVLPSPPENLPLTQPMIWVD